MNSVLLQMSLINKTTGVMSEAQSIGHDLIAELFGNSESESEAPTAEESTLDKTNAIKKQRTSGFSAHPGLSKLQGYRCCV